MFDGKLPHCEALISVDSEATAAVHVCLSEASGFCAENAMLGAENSKRAKGRP